MILKSRSLRRWAVPSTILLVAATVTGQWLTTQPVDRLTAAMMGHLSATCPSADRPSALPMTYRESAHLFDRWALRAGADLIDGKHRCGKASVRAVLEETGQKPKVRTDHKKWHRR